MKILVILKDIGYEPKEFKTTVSPEDMEYYGEYQILEDVKVNITVRRTDIGYSLSVRGETKMRFICARCLEEFEREYVFQDENILRKTLDSLEKLSDMDVETIYIDKDEVDVMPILRDIFLTFLPINPLCSPDCLGICPVCGVKMYKEEHKHNVQTRKLGDILKKEVRM